jgi:hypothetical protein
MNYSASPTKKLGKVTDHNSKSGFSIQLKPLSLL